VLAHSRCSGWVWRSWYPSATHKSTPMLTTQLIRSARATRNPASRSIAAVSTCSCRRPAVRVPLRWRSEAHLPGRMPRGEPGRIFRFGIATGRCKHDIAQDLRARSCPYMRAPRRNHGPEGDRGVQAGLDGYQGQPSTQFARHPMHRTATPGSRVRPRSRLTSGTFRRHLSPLCAPCSLELHRACRGAAA